MAKNVMTPNFRVSFPNVFKAKKNELSGKEEYSLVALFPKGTDLTELKKAVQEAIESKWGSDKSKWPKNLRTPFRDQGEKAKTDGGKTILPQGYEEGAYFINLKSQQRPDVVDQSKAKMGEERSHEFYAGCFARAIVNAYAYDAKGNKGVSFSLSCLQKVKDGDPMNGRPRAEDVFSPIEGATTEGGSATDLFT